MRCCCPRWPPQESPQWEACRGQHMASRCVVWLASGCVAFVNLPINPKEWSDALPGALCLVLLADQDNEA